MGDRPSHLRKAAHNTKFLNAVEGFDPRSNPKYPDWLVTIAFYIALHYVDARLAKMKMDPQSHLERDSMVANHLRPLSADYMFLKGKSELARYTPDSEKVISPPLVDRCLKLAVTRFT